MKFLSPRAHAALDYAIVGLLALAPTLFRFGGIAASLCYLGAAALLVMSLATAYPLGLVRFVPLPVHGVLELIAAPLFLAAPWVWGFAGALSARYFFVAMGVAAGVVWLVTDRGAAEHGARKRTGVLPPDHRRRGV